MRKLDFCQCINKGADQLCSNYTADQHLYYTESTIHLLLEIKISSVWPSSVTIQVGLCQTSSETPETNFLT